MVSLPKAVEQNLWASRTLLIFLTTRCTCFIVPWSFLIPNWWSGTIFLSSIGIDAKALESSRNRLIHLYGVSSCAFRGFGSHYNFRDFPEDWIVSYSYRCVKYLNIGLYPFVSFSNIFPIIKSKPVAFLEFVSIVIACLTS